MAKTIGVFSVPTPHEYDTQLHNHKRNIIFRNSWETVSYPRIIKSISPLCSPSSSTAVTEDGPSTSLPSPLALSGCKACGREEIEKGCNGEGRIQGGIATVPGFGWWPIKAYRPCPGFVASGGRYRRQGQSMDEVAFGRALTEATPLPTPTANQSEKKQSPKKFKR